MPRGGTGAPRPHRASQCMCAIEISIRVPPVVAGIFALPWEGVPPIERLRDAWSVELDGHTVRLTNLDKIFWPQEGYTKGDVVAYYLTVADQVLPYVRQRPLTMKRMPDGAFGDFFYAKQAPSHTPGWITTAPVEAIRSGARIDYVVPTDRASLAWLANLGCIELHPWHSRVESLGAPDYAFFDLDPFGVDFAAVRDVALHVRAVLDQLGLRSYPRTSGATGMQIYVPIDAVHAYGDVRAFVERCCALINQADPRRTTMAWDIDRRDGKVFLDHNMNTEGRNIAATGSLRPEPAAPVATPLTWDEVAGDVVPTDFTIATFGPELVARSALFAPVLAGGQRLAPAMAASPTPPQPNTATLSPGPTPPVWTAAPMPAMTPHPSRPATSGGAARSTGVHWPAGQSEEVADETAGWPRYELGDEAGREVGVAAGEVVPHQDHRDTPGEPDEDDPHHHLRTVGEQEQCEKEHHERTDDPVLYEGDPEQSQVAEDRRELLVAHLRKRRVHHQDEPDRDRDVRRADAELVPERGDPRREVARADADDHHEEDPQRQISIEDAQSAADTRHDSPPSPRRCSL